MPRPPGERSSEEEGERGEGGASNNLRTAMAGMGVGGYEMDKDETVEVEHDDT